MKTVNSISGNKCDYYWEVKDCKHKFHSVYYGSEWEIECEKCNKNIYKIYSQEDANEIINNDLLKK